MTERESQRERFDSVVSSSSSADPTSDGSTHPYGGGERLYSSTSMADSSVSLTESDSQMPLRPPYAHLSASASTSTIRLVSPSREAEDDPFGDESREEDEAPGGGGDRRPAHERGDSRGSSRFVEGE